MKLNRETLEGVANFAFAALAPLATVAWLIARF
jgi:hypothetical protein